MQFKVKGILSYPNLFQARAIEAGKDPKYSVSVFIKKSDPQVQAIHTIIDTEKQNGFPSGFPANGKVFMKDCAVAFPDQIEIHDYMVISGNSQLDNKPSVVDMNMQPVIDPALIFAGAVCWVAFNSFSYKKAVNKGIAAGLNAVMLTEESGELGRLDGRPSVESMFSDVIGGEAPVGAVSPSGGVALVPNAPVEYTMTPKAGTFTRKQYLDSGWTDEKLIAEGYMS